MTMATYHNPYKERLPRALSHGDTIEMGPHKYRFLYHRMTCQYFRAHTEEQIDRELVKKGFDLDRFMTVTEDVAFNVVSYTQFLGLDTPLRATPTRGPDQDPDTP